jgi:hypothetical protein
MKKANEKDMEVETAFSSYLENKWINLNLAALLQE